MYFLQETGQRLKLNYVKGSYGPYAENLNHALQTLEGHYLRGYGDRSQEVLKLSPITFLSNAEPEALRWLENHPDQTLERIDRVAALIAGFASAYGLELLGTVHWIATKEQPGQISNPQELAHRISDWNERKGLLFTEFHVRQAVSHLQALGWLTNPAET